MPTAEKYLQLLQEFPPRPINSESDLETVQNVIYRLLDKSELSEEEEDYLDVLGTLVFDYESQQDDLIPDIYGVELLAALIVERNLQPQDLVSIFKTESIVSDVLNEKCQLTLQHIQELAELFNLSPAVFLPIKSPNLVCLEKLSHNSQSQ
jgi:HTH-type transcriptional regulator/antitoxin HigA